MDPGACVVPGGLLGGRVASPTGHRPQAARLQQPHSTSLHGRCLCALVLSHPTTPAAVHHDSRLIFHLAVPVLPRAHQGGGQHYYSYLIDNHGSASCSALYVAWRTTVCAARGSETAERPSRGFGHEATAPALHTRQPCQTSGLSVTFPLMND